MNARRLLLLVLLLLSTAACSAVRVRDTPIDDYIATQRGDVLTGEDLSAASRESLLVLGLDARTCVKIVSPCLSQLRQSSELDDERRLAAMAELQMSEALAMDRSTASGHSSLDAMDRYAEVARLSYAYLFFTARAPGQRAFEDRQTQLRDFYNHAMERFTTLAFQQQGPSRSERMDLQLAHWRIRLGDVRVRMPQGEQPWGLVPASRLRFDGIRSTYRRDGFGATFVTVTRPTVPVSDAGPVRESRFLASTAILRFPGETLQEVLAADTASIDVYDPYQHAEVRIGGHIVPLAANFTAPYALWLSRSKFAREADLALLRKSASLAAPRVYLMQPFDPQRRTIVLLHGLGSSPEAWVNLANEIMGDDTLRRRYQIWQVFYPTNLPIAENRKNIRQALLDTFHALDPDGTAAASQHVTLIGHSMGGVISRLLVVDSRDALWRALFEKPVNAAQRRRLAMLEPYLTLEPLAQVDRAIFLASPHRGSPVASGWLGRLGTRVVSLPAAVFQTIANVADAIQHDAPEEAERLRQQKMTSVGNLSDQDRYLGVTSTLPIATSVTYHSIIGRRDADVALHDATDGAVPYTSAHLDGAASELVVTSGHSVQETPAAILEIRRILREALTAPAD